MTVFDWLEGIPLPHGATPYDVVEVRFKNNRKMYVRRPGSMTCHVGDVVVIDLNPGHDVGVVSLTGELVKTQLKLRKIKDDHELKRIERKATQEDLGLWHTARMREDDTLREARAIIRRIGISMKLTDVEFQGDNGRATFYYISEQRVDFRELVRELARTFDIRVDMRQIGARQEAARVGGIGVCGRELCCTSWLKDFRSVSTGAARYQQLSLNPGKLAGQCGKLKCCLNFELDQYVEAVKEFPSPNAKIKTPKGKAVVFKMDIFKRLVYLLELGEPGASPVAVSVEDANALIAASERGEVAQGLQSFVIEDEPDEVDETFGNVVGQEDLTRFDEAKRRRRGKGRRQGGRSGQRSRQGGNDAPASAKSESGSSKGEAVKGGGRSGRKPTGRSRGKRRGGGGNSGAPNASNG
jgi:cell fate regulator YaaT (PSP1 superfamily)